MGGGIYRTSRFMASFNLDKFLVFDVDTDNPGNIRRIWRTAVFGTSKLRKTLLTACSGHVVIVLYTSASSLIGTRGNAVRGLSQVHFVSSNFFTKLRTLIYGT